MLALSPQLSNIGWLLDDPLRHDHHQFDNSYCLSAVARAFTSDHSNIDLIESPTSQAKSCDLASFCDEFVNQGDASAAAAAPGGNIVKKMNHNASERDRRKKINEQYSTLRSLLPPQDQSSKLSIPATISRVLKYIPDLQNEVERLEAKKERFMSKVSVQQESSKANQKRTKSTHDDGLSSTAVSATQITNREVIIQISVPKVGKSAVYETIAILEQDGLLLLNATCTDSSQRVFCNLHVQAQGDQAVDAEMVKEKLLAFYEKAQQLHY